MTEQITPIITREIIQEMIRPVIHAVTGSNTKADMVIIQNILRKLRTKPDAIPHLLQHQAGSGNCGDKSYGGLKAIEDFIGQWPDIRSAYRKHG